MKIYRLSQSETSETSENEFILGAGTVLYHGTIEKFEYDRPTVGIDNVFWATQYANIAKSYIPESGGRMYTNANNIANPTQDTTTLWLQRALGIEYDMSKVQFEGVRIKSYPLPKVFEDPMYWDYKVDGYMDNKCKYVVEKMKDVFGYSPTNKDQPCYSRFELKTKGNEVMHSDYKAEGRLLEVTTLHDLLIYDFTNGGKKDGDLMEADYRKYGLLQKLSTSKYDGVKINDFHTTKHMGTFGHTSIGFFSKSLESLNVFDSSATHPEGSLY